MTYEERVELLNGLRKQFSWLMADVAEYESGRPGSAAENGIHAAHKCAQMAAKLRRQADNLAIMIAAYEDVNENDCSRKVGRLDGQGRQGAELPL